MAERIGVGIIGANMTYGWGTRAHLPALAGIPEFELVAACTTRMETAEATAKHFRIAHAFDNTEAMVQHPDVDLVVVCVRVPAHHGLVTLALNAGKHVFCEWPLGANLSEAVELRDLARTKGVRHMVGLQARGAPVFNYAKQLVAEGYIGRVLSCTMNGSLPGAGTRQEAFAWAADRTKGANTLTIHGGHSIHALCFVLGEFRDVSATVAAQVARAKVVETGAEIEVTAPDHMLVNGVLESGALASVSIRNVPTHGTGFSFEIHGTEGALAISGEAAAQIGELTLRGGRKDEPAMRPMEVPAKYRWAPATVPEGAPLNVGQLFCRLADGIRSGAPVDPDFDVAVRRHELLAALERASESGQRQRL